MKTNNLLINYLIINFHELQKYLYNCTLALFSFQTNFTLAQTVGNGAVTSGFGIDGDIESDTARNGSVASISGRGLNSDDWFKYKSNGSGIGIIDTSGDAAKKVAYTASSTVYNNSTFTKGLAVPKLSLSNGYILLDGLFGKDYTGAGELTAMSGGKTTDFPTSWTIGNYSVNNKGDIVDFGSHVRRKGQRVEDSLFIVVAMSVKSNTGAKNASIELFVEDVTLNTSTGKLSSPGTDDGRKAWKFNKNGEITQIGDFTLSFDYSNNGGFNIEPRIWVHDSFRNSAKSGYIVPDNFNWATGSNNFVASSAGNFGYQVIAPKSGARFAWGVASVLAGAKTPPYGSVNASGTYGTAYSSEQFIEVSVNLTSLGVDPSQIAGIDPCSVPFRTIVYRTRQSAAFNSTLEDFAGPYPFWRYPVIGTTGTTDTLDCRKTSANLSIIDGYNLAYYNWRTIPSTGATITGYNNDSTQITVGSGGTYILESAPLEGCYLTRDTIVVLQDTVTPVAKVIISDTLIVNSVYSVTIQGGDTALTKAKMNATSGLFGPSQGLTWQWTGTQNFTSTLQSPSASDSGIYRLVLTENRNGCTDTALGVLVMLPVDLEILNCLESSRGNAISWTTQSEFNVSHFEIQKWKQGTFSNIGTVNAVGNSPSAQQYRFVDENKENTGNVYRIAMYDVKNKVTYSDPCVVHSSGNTDAAAVITVYPNPAHSELTIFHPEYTQTSAQIQITDVTGKLILKSNIEFDASGKAILPVQSLPTGLHLMQIRTAQGESSTSKFIKE